MKQVILILLLSIILAGCEFDECVNPFVSPVPKPQQQKQLECNYNWLDGMVCEYK